MRDFASTCTRIREIFCEELQIKPLPVEHDLLEAGLLDSMMFVSLLMHLEEEFGVKVALQDIEITDFSTIAKIAKVVVAAVDQQAA